MAFYIPQHGNVVIDRKTGDGFMQSCLPYFPSNAYFVTVKPRIGAGLYDRVPNRVGTLHALRKRVESGTFDYDTVVIDCRLPRVGSKAYKALLRACTNRRIIFIEMPFDWSSVAVTMSLLSVTKAVRLRIIKFDRFLFNKRW